MNRKASQSLTKWLPAFVLLSALLACNVSQAVTPTIPSVSGQNIPPTAACVQTSAPTSRSTAEPVQPTITETPTTKPIVHTATSAEPPAGSLSEITDRNSSAFATQKRTNGGDSFVANLYERPFNATSMDTYYPDLDITRARLFQDSQWTYVSIYVVGQNPAGGLPRDYGVEVDLNMDSRGDVLVMAVKPGTAWSTDGVQAWLDKTHDVGGVHPIQSDAPANTNGYETVVFDSGNGIDPDTAWARVSPSDPKIVQIAFKSTLINDSDKFTWGAWTMNASMLNPGWFDYNDHFTATDAGSPLIELTQYYPIKALAEVDNTCRWAVGFIPTGTEPGICPVPPTPTPPPPVLPGTISGIVFNNGINGDLILHPTSIKIMGASVRARSGDCASPGSVVDTAMSNANGLYTLTVPAGSYCVDVSPDPVGYSHKTDPQTVIVANGGTVTDINFGYWKYIGMR